MAKIQIMKKIYSILVLFLLSAFLSITVLQAQTTADALKKHVSFLAADSLEGRGLGTEGKEKAMHYISVVFSDAGLLPFGPNYFQEFSFRKELIRVNATNVIGYIEGSDEQLKNEYIVLSAHYDHLGFDTKNDGSKVIYNGADDNASGTAALLELAKYFGSDQNTPKRSIIFIAYDAEEIGLLGSEFFVEDSEVVDFEKVKFNFNFDMVGMYDSYGGLDITGINGIANGKNKAKELAKEYDVKLKKTTASIEPFTDTYSFKKTGTPAVHFFTGLKSPYHKPEDTYDLLEYEAMAKVVNYSAALTKALANEEELEPSGRFKNLQSPFALRLNAGVSGIFTNSYHIYRDEFFNAEDVPGGSFGLITQLDIGKRVTLQPGVFYAYHGSSAPGGNYRAHSLDIPVDAHINLISQYGGQLKLFLILGGFYRHDFSTRNADVDGRGIRDEDHGFSLGFGFRATRLQFTFVGRSGIQNLTRVPDMDIRSQGGLISLSYLFFK